MMIIWDKQWNSEDDWREDLRLAAKEVERGLAATACLLLEYIYGVFIFHLQLRTVLNN